MTKQTTNTIKGIAIIFVLYHHLFTSEKVNAKYGVIWSLLGDRGIHTANFKFAVAAFVFLSCYGLVRQYEKRKLATPGDYARDGCRRYVGLVLNLWWVLFPMLILAQILGKHTFSDIYCGDGFFNAGKYFLYELMGISKFFDAPTISGPWWYFSLAILLFIVTPLTNKLYDHIGALIIPLSLMMKVMLTTDVAITDNLIRRLFVISVAVVCARADIFEKWQIFWQNYKKLSVLPVITMLVVIAVLYKMMCVGAIRALYREDYVAVLIIFIMVTVCEWRLFTPIAKGLEYIGKHSNNIFMIHCFYRTAFFTNFTYSFRYWWLILAVLVADSLLFSIVLEFIKKKVGYPKLVKKINYRIDHIGLPKETGESESAA